jgi:hypothetical protein
MATDFEDSEDSENFENESNVLFFIHFRIQEIDNFQSFNLHMKTLLR